MHTVVVEIAGRSSETFSAKQIVDATGLLSSVVYPLVRKLRDAQFIEYVGQVPGQRTMLYRVVENYWWDAARHYAAERSEPVGGALPFTRGAATN